MADGNSHPFNSDVIAVETIEQLHKQLSNQQQQQAQTSKNKDLLDLLSSNNTSNHFFNSTDSSSRNISSQTISDDDFNRLKSYLRTTIWPINHSIHRQLWMNILTLNRLGTSKQTHHHHPSPGPISTASMPMDPSFFSSVPSKLHQWPSFVDTTNLCFYHLTEPTGRLILQRLLFTFAMHHPDVTYCPALQPFCSLFLHYFNEHEVLFLINRLLAKRWLYGETRLQWEANCNVFKKLLRIYYKSSADAVEVRFTNSKLFYQEWFWWIFRHLPFSYIGKIMDCFLLEGPKILYRIALALVHLFTKTMKNDSSEQNRTMAEFCQEIPFSIEHLLRVAFHIRNLKRSTIEQLMDHEEKSLHTNRYHSRNDENELNSSTPSNNNDNTTNTNLNTSKTNGSSGERQSTLITHQQLTRIPKTSILDHQQFVTIWNWLPVRFSLSQPILLFTTQEHGFRLQSLLERIDDVEYSILIIRTTNGEVFGAFCAGLWSDRRNKTYFGFGESFLFTLVPEAIKYPWVGQRQSSQTQDNEHRQQQIKRELFLFVSSEKIIIGGGNGDGLCIDSSLCEGRSSHCETFNNEPLCSSASFSVSVLEMHTFDFSTS